MVVARLKKRRQRGVAMPGHQAVRQLIAIDQDRYRAHIAKRNERKVVGRYDGPLDRYDRRFDDQPLAAGPAFVRGYAARRPSVKLQKQSEFD